MPRLNGPRQSSGRQPAASSGQRSSMPTSLRQRTGKGVFAAVEYKAPEAAGGEFPFAVEGQWPMGTLSLHTAEILREFPEPVGVINKADAKALGIADGSSVKVTAKSGASVQVRAEVTTDIKQGVIAVPGMHGAAVAKVEKVSGGN